MASAEELRGHMVRAAALLFETGVMSASGHGNISTRIDGERILLTRVSNLRRLSAADIAIVTLRGEVLEGELSPTTSEVIPMHTEVYRARDDVSSVIHTHSPNITAFAIANQPLPCAYEGLLRRGAAEPIPVAAWAPRGSRESVTNTVDQIRAHAAAPAVLLGNHGLLAFTPHEATFTAQVIVSLEEGAQMILGARSLGGERPLPPDALKRERAHMGEFGTTHEHLT